MSKPRRLSADSLVGLEELASARTSAPPEPTSDPAVSRSTPVSRSTLPEGARVEAAGTGVGVSRSTLPEAAQLIVDLPLSSIKRNPHQPRRTIDPDSHEIVALAESIAARGRVLQPILVRPAEEPSDVPFELVAGERRWIASGKAGLSAIRAIVEGVDNATSAEMALVENMARNNLNPMEEARGCALLRDQFGLSIAEIARRVSRGRTAISHLVGLLDLPDVVQDLIAAGELSEGHGRVLLSLKDYEAEAELGGRCAAEGWSVRELERRADAHKSGAVAVPERPADELAALEGLHDRLAPLFGTAPVKLVPRRHGTYELQVRFADLAALTQAVSRLR